MKGIRKLLRCYLVPTILLGGLVAITTFYFVNQPEFSGDLVNGVFRMDWGDVKEIKYRSIRADFARKAWGIRIYHQNPSGTKWVPGAPQSESRWDFGIAAGRRISGNEMPLWEMQILSWVGITAVASIPLLYFLYGSVTRHRRVRRRQCIFCGYSIIGWLSNRCPECGTARRESPKRYGARALGLALLLVSLIGGAFRQVIGFHSAAGSTTVTAMTTNNLTSSGFPTCGTGMLMPTRVQLSEEIFEACEAVGISRPELDWIVNGDQYTKTTLSERVSKYVDIERVDKISSRCGLWLYNLGKRPVPAQGL